MTDVAMLEVGIPEALIQLVADRVIEQLGAPEPRRWMTTAQVACYTSLGRHTIYKLAEAGEIPHRRPLTGRLLFEQSEVDGWLDNSQRGRK